MSDVIDFPNGVSPEARSDADVADALVQTIREAIYAYSGEISLATVIGALECAKLEIALENTSMENIH